ncbi:MAG: hypothetical protein CFE45_24190 [Burkholderiales bacterium PBB5]|nr:MAG: hypothetical protein CFE45_24190 [Burkholderiales bacterium PBB5]
MPCPPSAFRRREAGMLRSALAIAFSGASLACGMAGIGLALYGNGPQAWAAAQLFGAIGLVAGLACGCLHAVLAGQPVAEPERLSPEALAQLVRTTVAAAKAERQARPGSAADRRPTEPHVLTAAEAAPDAAAAPPEASPAAAPTPATSNGRQFASSAFGA